MVNDVRSLDKMPMPSFLHLNFYFILAYSWLIKPVNPKGNQPWILIGMTDAEAPILWSPDAKSRLIGKDPDAGKDWGQDEKRETEDEMLR